MPVRYAPLQSQNAQDAEQELDAAFESDDDEETAPLQPQTHHPGISAQTSHTTSTIPGGYNFEADFDYAVPPPGSPPGPSTFAHPNQYGNSNGQLPSATIVPPVGRRGFFRRTMGALLPTHYQRIATEDGASVVGGGTNNDGVFANLTAKPGRGRVVQDGESIHVVPEEVQKEVPPSYAVAQADQAPAYYDTIVHAPSSGLDGEVLVDALPTGSLFTFAWTMLISLSFQFVGFLLTYLLHTSHASKYGSRAGLGVTIIQYAFFLRRRASVVLASDHYDNYQQWWDASGPSDDGELPPPLSEFNGTSPDATPTTDSNYSATIVASATTEWLAFLLMTVGWFVLLTSLLGFWRVKRWERGVRQANEPAPVSTSEDVERDRNARENLMIVLNMFGMSADRTRDGHDSVPMTATSEDLRTEEERRLENDLRTTGLL